MNIWSPQMKNLEPLNKFILILSW